MSSFFNFSIWNRKRLQYAIVRHRSNPVDSWMIIIILLSGVMVGLETFPTLYANYLDMFHAVDAIIIGLFSLEAAIKMSFYGKRPWRYFTSGWNIFDFGILVLTTLPFILANDYSSAQSAIALRSLSLIRSLRALRFMRIASELPGIRVIVETLIRSLPQLAVVGLLLFSLIYTYGVIGYNLFHLNDPKHFGTLWQSILTMFQCAVGEFYDTMHIQIDGSNYDSGYYESLCLHYGTVVPERFPILSPIFFLSFVFVAGLTILNFFVGTIISELDSVREEEHQQTSDLALLLKRFDKLESLIKERDK